MSKTHVFDRFDVGSNRLDDEDVERWPCSDGYWVKAEDAINRDAALQARIRTLEVQWNDAEKRAMLNHKKAEAARTAALDEAAAVVREHNREGRGWIPGSLWDTLANEAAARIEALKVKDDVSRLFPVVDGQTLEKKA
jgi:hypothetical protein